MRLIVEVKSTVIKPIDIVFNAIIHKDKITKYFVSHSNGDLIEKAQVNWEWRDFCAECIVTVLAIEKDKRILFSWSGNNVTTEVEMTLTALETSTEIIITESSYEKNEEGIKKVMQQTQGWTDFICSLKAYLYTGINLRNGKMND